MAESFLKYSNNNTEDSGFKLTVEEHDLNKTYLEMLISDIRNYKVEILDRIGNGSFGQIFKIKLISNQRQEWTIAAMKNVKRSKVYGLNSLLEPYIIP